MTEDPEKNLSLYQRWFRSEVGIAFSFGLILWGVFTYLQNPQIRQQMTNDEINKNIALIQQSVDNINKNHEAHIQDIVQDLKEQKDQILDLQKQSIQLQTANQIILSKLKP